jgi:hypothetical protein
MMIFQNFSFWKRLKSVHVKILLDVLEIDKTHYFRRQKTYSKKISHKEKKMKNFILALLLSMIAAAGAQAQNLPANLWSSPQSATTEGRYRSNADDFIRPDAYTGVKFNKWFGMASFLNDTATNEAMATAGFAASVFNVYVGAFYSGNFWTSAPVNNYIEQEPATTPNGGVDGRPYDVYDSISVSGVSNPVNNFALLIGYYDMGLRITYRTNHQLFKESDIVTENQLYKNYHDESGYIAPQIAWAMAKDLIKNGIRPYVTIDLVFYRDYQETETAGADANGLSGVKTGRSLNHFDPAFAVGLGGYTFYNKDGFKASADLDYALTFNLYDNEYSYVENGKYKTGKITGTYSPGSNPYVQEYFISNLITPSISGSWSEDRLALKLKLNLPLMFSSREQDSMDVNDSGNLVYHGDSNLITTFTFRPDLRLALQYKIIPNKLTLNTGARIQTTAITRETINQEHYTNHERDYGRRIHNNSFGGSFISRFSIGPAFYLTENSWIEATTGVTNAYGNEGVIDVFAPGGLFSFGSILAALKF